MATDIVLSKSENLIANGSVIASCSPTGFFSVLYENIPHASGARELNTPTISEIESKYDNRFDDVNYYMGGGSSDGGYYTGDILGI